MADEPDQDDPTGGDSDGAFEQMPTTVFESRSEPEAGGARLGADPTSPVPLAKPAAARHTPLGTFGPGTVLPGQTRPFPVTHEVVIEDAELQQFIDRALRPDEGRIISYGEFARGGMGIIERLDDRVLLRQTAVKVLRDEYRLDEPAMRDFVREAQITGQLEHPNIIPIYELGSTPDGRLCLVMRLIEGRTLGELIEALPPGPIERGRLLDLVDVLLRVCDALAFAHSRGVAHCDVKPGNVMVADFGQVYLMDWGIAQLVGIEDDTGARPVSCSVDAEIRNPVRGTPSCMAPEQAEGEEVSPRTDVFAVGALIYCVLCRRTPYAWNDAEKALEQACECRFRVPSDVVETHPELSRIMLRAMELNPRDRYPSIVELQRDIVRFVRGDWDFPHMEISAGEPVVREGEVGDAAYIIERGRCDVIKLIDGKPVKLREMGPGEVFGETAILAASPRTASVIATEDTALLRVTREVLEAEVGAMKPWMSTFIRTLAERFRDRESKR